MRVLLDARAMPGHRLGVAQYTLRLAAGVADLCDLAVLARRDDVDAFPDMDVIAQRPLPRPVRLAAEVLVDARRINRRRPDLFHGMHYSLPPGLRVPATVTFHDETLLTMPWVHERAKVLWFRRAIPQGIARAERVICVSESARRGAILHAGADPAHTHTVPLAVDHDRFRPAADEAERACERARLEDRYGIGAAPYLLWIGAIEPRKDVPTLVRAFSRLGADHPHTLVLAGPPAWGADALDAALDDSPMRTRVVRTGWFDEADKPALYRSAAAFAYPSLAEGFGLPVLEALACGTPTVTTTGSATEEVAGGAALTVAPGDDVALAAALARAIGPDGDRLRSAGPTRAAAFTWEATARATVDVWRLACA